MTDDTVYEAWHEYRCVECSDDHERPLVMLLDDTDDEVPAYSPRCLAFRSLMYERCHEQFV
jgi:hypothetical protein